MLPPKARLTLRGNYKSTKRTGSTATPPPSAPKNSAAFRLTPAANGGHLTVPGVPLYHSTRLATRPRRGFCFILIYMEQIKSFLADESGQDLIEYTLLMSFVALASAALFIGAGKNVKGIWVKTSTQLSAANAAI